MISLIAALEKESLVIGKDGKLPWHISEDLKFYKKTTQNKITIMGRRTFSSIDPKIFKNRQNIVISTTLKYAEHSTVYPSLDLALKELLLSYGDSKDIIICGGSRIYKEALPYVERMYLTLVTKENISGDTYFPLIDYSEWRYTFSSVPSITKEGIAYTFNTLERI